MDMDAFFDTDQVCLREMQAFHKVLDHEKGFSTDMLRNVAFLSEEVGEVVTAIREFENADAPSVREAAKADLAEELADCLAYIIKLANYGGVDLQEAYVQKMKRNLNRTWPKKPGVT